MALVDAGALSLGASGTIGKTMTFSSWKGRPYVRRRVIPSNPKSAPQMATRAWMRWGSRVWASLSGANQATWQTRADAQKFSPFNAFVQLGMTNQVQGSGFQREDPAEASDPPAAPTGASATAGVRQLVLDWTDPATGDVFGVIIYRSTTTGFTPGPSNVIAVVDAGVETYVDTGLETGTPYYYRAAGFDFAGVLGSLVAQFTGTPN